MASPLSFLVSRRQALLLYVLYGFTLIAVAGFGIFGLHPELLARWPQLVTFYAHSFKLFARLHVLLTAFVLFVYLTQHVGWRWVPAGLVIYGISLLSETLGTTYGLPFGQYKYTGLLGGKWFDRVPYLIPLSWFVMAVPCFGIARAAFPELKQRPIRLLLATYLLVVWDLSLDPAMSYLTAYWSWGERGPYYGMPLINLAGWALTGLVIMGALEAMQAHRWTASLSVRWLIAFYGAVLLMPLGMVAVAGLWGAVGATLAALMLASVLLWWPKRRKPEAARETALVKGQQAAFEADRSRFFANHARSFAFAARLFPRSVRQEVVLLYGFCRLTDDLVDGVETSSTGPAAIKARLDQWEQQVYKAYEGQPSGISWLDALMQRSRMAGLPWAVVQALFDGVRQDIGPVRLASYAELDRYAYCVGSTVGIWMCYLMKVSDPELLVRAEALGRAMQYTNILRDVGEDLQRDRIYLPAERMAAYGLDETALRKMQAQGLLMPAYVELLEELMQRAERDYEVAWEAIPALPPRLRAAIAVAADVYRGIHNVIRRNRYDNLRRRAYTSFVEKNKLAWNALWRLYRVDQRISVVHGV